LGATVRFSLPLQGIGPQGVDFRILNLSYVTAHGPKYELGGTLHQVPTHVKPALPPYNFIFVKYNTEERTGTMEFSYAE
jgi:hypothetical protein